MKERFLSIGIVQQRKILSPDGNPAHGRATLIPRKGGSHGNPDKVPEGTGREPTEIAKDLVEEYPESDAFKDLLKSAERSAEK